MWQNYKGTRDRAAGRYKPRPHFRHGSPYPEAPEKDYRLLSESFQSPRYPLSGQYTADPDSGVTETVTVVGTPGPGPDGISYVKTLEHGLLPADKVNIDSEPKYPYDAMWDRGDGSEPVLVTVIGSFGEIKSPDGHEYLRVQGQPGGVPVEQLQFVVDAPFGENALPRTLNRDRGWQESKAKRAKAAEGQRYASNPRYKHEVPMPWRPNVDIKEVDEPVGGILTLPEGNGFRREQVTVLGSGTDAEGKKWVRTYEHGLVPAILVSTLESEIGFDSTKFELKGLGPAIYYVKVKRHMGDYGRDIASRTAKLGISEKDYQARALASAAMPADKPKTGVYSFKEAAEKDTQSGRLFYLGRPQHPVNVWFSSRNYKGSLNPERKKELQDQRKVGLALQEAISGRAVWRRIFNPNGLYRKELSEFSLSTPAALGFRAIEFARIQQIARQQHKALTQGQTRGQWAISVMNGEKLTERESRDLIHHLRTSPFNPRYSVRPQPETQDPPRVSPHLATS